MNPFIYFNKQNQNWSIVIKEVDENNFQITYQTIHGFQTKADAEDLFNVKMEQFEKDMAKIKKNSRGRIYTFYIFGVLV